MSGPQVADRIVELLQREGAEHVVGFPENRLLDSAARAGMRPIVERPADLRGALERCIASVAAGQAALCEVARERHGGHLTILSETASQ